MAVATLYTVDCGAAQAAIVVVAYPYPLCLRVSVSESSCAPGSEGRPLAGASGARRQAWPDSSGAAGVAAGGEGSGARSMTLSFNDS